MMYDEDIMFSRQGVGAPLTAAVARAKKIQQRQM